MFLLLYFFASSESHF